MKEAHCVLLCTGGIGSGKSVVVRVFQELGVPVYDCDRAAKECYDRDPQLLAEVVALCGEAVLDASGRLDRAALSRRIFGDPVLLAAVEDRVHPAVIRDFENWKRQQESGLVVIESAILLEKPRFAGLMDFTVVVTAPEAVRIRRVMQRDGLTEAQVRKRMAAQWSDEARIAQADFVLENNDRQALLPAVLQITEKIKRRWKKQI
jgi:dephospho-CoA kinase